MNKTTTTTLKEPTGYRELLECTRTGERLLVHTLATNPNIAKKWIEHLDDHHEEKIAGAMQDHLKTKETAEHQLKRAEFKSILLQHIDEHNAFVDAHKEVIAGALSAKQPVSATASGKQVDVAKIEADMRNLTVSSSSPSLRELPNILNFEQAPPPRVNNHDEEAGGEGDAYGEEEAKPQELRVE